MKKGISPLVSTIVLIVFAIVLGILVMGWGKNYAPKVQESCQDTSLKLITIDEKPIACYSNDIFYATIENNGQTDIAGLKVSSIGEEISSASVELEIPVAAITKIQAQVYYPDKIIIAPKIKERICPKQQLEIENIAPC